MWISEGKLRGVEICIVIDFM